MAEFDAHPLLITGTVGVWDVICPGVHKRKAAEECVPATHVVFPYRGVYVHHVGRTEAIAEANQTIFINEDEPYQISHPVEGGDASLSIWISAATLFELAPKEYLRTNGQAAFNRSRLRIDANAQTLMASLRHSLNRGAGETLEAESLTIALLRRALGERTRRATNGSLGRQRLVDRAKLVLASDLGRRWTLAEIAVEVGVSPVYLTQVFQQFEGIPLYRYQLQLRLARALDLLGDHDKLADLAFELGFSSHSHFSAAFKQAYGQTPSAFRRSARIR
ncbi:helix-turn-helix transcriptional regulator [Pseudonocardia alaniniphila]|uniref:AraC family transcriptional regulator n=1 Tax=Pseudonocardia alaniniphila TaxID=75291 RepID=A0ABS9TV09_9PSEU|nr:AraC family transcriptional regulator [Pseudonocardia alaniniphila]MCH6172394.1 AraC family transcriptional regulator [Pseudonocardia alaniniphila]